MIFAKINKPDKYFCVSENMFNRLKPNKKQYCTFFTLLIIAPELVECIFIK